MEKPQYYAVIPASVRYCKECSANAKLLYGEVSALTNKYGFCFASNQHFANLYDVRTEAVSRWISQLKNAGHIGVTSIKVSASSNVRERRITIVVDAPKHKGGSDSAQRPHAKKVKTFNSKETNTKVSKGFRKPTLTEVAEYVATREVDISATKFLNYYESNGWRVGKTKMSDWKAAVRTWVENEKKRIHDGTRNESIRKTSIIDRLKDRSWAGK